MSCKDFEQHLDDWVDGGLDEMSADRVRRHLATCDHCRVLADELAEVARIARELPTEVEPDRDLWPDIVARLEEQDVVRPRFSGRDTTVFRSWRPWLAVAAALLLTAVAAYQLGRQQAVVVVEGAVGSSDIQRASLTVPTGDVDAELREVRDDLRARLAARRDQLDPATLQVVDDNLAVIDDAIVRITAALETDPSNGRLTRQLVFAYRQQIDLLRRAAEAPREL
jgi:anti-sigma factor RsiW